MSEFSADMDWLWLLWFIAGSVLVGALYWVYKRNRGYKRDRLGGATDFLFADGWYYAIGGLIMMFGLGVVLHFLLMALGTDADDVPPFLIGFSLALITAGFNEWYDRRQQRPGVDA